MPEESNIVEGRGLTKVFGAPPACVHALRGLDIRVRRGEFLAVMGPSGCGKSTLLHILGLMTWADGGSLAIDGTNIGTLSDLSPPLGYDCDDPGGDRPVPLDERGRSKIRRSKIGFVFQRFNLLGVLSGYDNIRLSLRIRGLDDDGRIGPLLEAMGVADAARRKPGRMSIGQQQRLAVARAVAHRPDILLADEPTGSLDSDNTAALLELLSQQNRRRGQTIVMITHSPTVAAAAGRILHMQDGRIVQPTR